MNREERNDLARRAIDGQRVNHKGWSRGDCPFCITRVGKADRKGCFGLNSRTGRFHCFRCGIAGRLSGFEDLPFDPLIPDGVDDVQPPENFESLAEGALFGALCAKPYLEYLHRRGVKDSMILELGIGACLTGKYGNRVIVPVKDDDGEWLWWIGRSIWTETKRKYIYPPGSRNEILFNHKALLEETGEPVMIVEGAFDALALWPDAVAVLGKPTESQIAAFAAARRPLAVVLDGDAHEEGWALGLRLKHEGCAAGSVRLPPRTDPDEVPLGELRAAARRCLALVEPARIM